MKKNKKSRKLRLEPLAARNLMAADGFGDFNGDGYDDLVVGDPNQVVAGQRSAGAVQVTYGNRKGLDSSHSQTLTQSSFSKAESYDRFGQSYAVGDFNHDGYDDLAVGSPQEDIGKLSNAGMVSVFYGSKAGLRTNNVRVLHQNTSGIQGSAEVGDQFGYALAAGDFDNDGYDDLAVGAPEDSVSGQARAGLVNVIFGSKSGLQTRDAIYSQNTSGVAGTSEKNDYFGSSLAAGDFNGDGHDDLAIGVPREDVGSIVDAGAINVLYGSNTGLKTTGDQVYHQNTSGILGTAEASDRFGHDLAAGDFNGDGRDDLAIGVPYENIGKIRDAGAVAVIYGSKNGLGTSDALFYQGNQGIAGTAENYDKFGFSVSAGDVNGDGRDELAVGTPYEDHSGRVDAGAVTVIFGSKSGLTNRDIILSQAISTIAGAAERNDRFASDVAFGDFNGDGKADLAALVSGESFGAYDARTATNVFYGTTGSLAKGKNQLWVHARQTKNGFTLSEDSGETEPILIPEEVSGTFLSDNENSHVDIPQEVSGSFLVDFDPEAIAKRGNGDAESYSYNDIQQQQSASCVFSSALAAVARTNFNFSSHIKYAGTSGDAYKYKVKLYHHETHKATWITVTYDGTREGVDMGYADQGEFWTVLYLRAYAKMYNFKLSELGDDKNASFRNTTTAMETITGKSADYDKISTDTKAQQLDVAKALAAGKAVLATSVSADGKTDILVKGGIGKTGLIAWHGYTVLAVQNAGKSNATVTLRNPWGKDNNLDASDYNDGFSSASRFEGDKVNNDVQDGIVRVSWTNFSRYFTGYTIGSV